MQARLRNLVDFYKKFEDMNEARAYIVFAFDEQLGLWKIYNKQIINAGSLSSSWIRGPHLALRKPLYHSCYL
jgi:hypothetical protein